MKTYKDYTVTELLDMFKDKIEEDIEDITYMVFFEKDDEKKGIEQQTKTDKGNNGQYQGKCIKSYESIYQIFLANEDLNEDNARKVSFLFEIYRRYLATLSTKEIKIIKELTLQENPCAIYAYNSPIYKGIKDYEIITREGTEKISAMRIDKSKEVIAKCLQEVIFSDDVQAVIKGKYSNRCICNYYE